MVTLNAYIAEEVMGEDTLLTPEQEELKKEPIKGKKRAVMEAIQYWPTDQPIYYSLGEKVNGLLSSPHFFFALL